MSEGARVERCRLAFVCGQRWDDLEVLPAHEGMRFCLRCQATVHLATTPDAFAAHAAQGRCVALAIERARILIGQPERPYPTLRIVKKKEPGMPDPAAPGASHDATDYDPQEKPG